ncbi:MAG: hypothetical protein WCE21_03815 [Candidatus Babeliales bacterium]
MILYAVALIAILLSEQQGLFAAVLKNERMTFAHGLINANLQIKFKPESVFLVNANLLNRNISTDFIYQSAHTLDTNFGFEYGKSCYDYNPFEFFMSMRNKSVWGNPESIAQTTDTSIRQLEAVFGDHKHFITKHLMWLREWWLDFSVTDAFGLPTQSVHRLKLGAFPFDLGRGIALGSAYAVGPRVLGFYSDNAINQYAFGFKFYGDLIRSDITYDLYLAILENKMDSFSNTNAKILGQEFGKKLHQERGTGKVDFVAASRFKWVPVKAAGSLVAFEPYALYNYAPEQRIEFLGDSSSKLATIGMAGEFEYSSVEWGFDIAKNFGSQQVKGWDRNLTEFENRNGVPTIVNSQVRVDNSKGPKVVYVPRSDAQMLIENSIQNAAENGQFIGDADGGALYNSQHRFSNPYTNKFTGWMFVADATYNCNPEKTLKVSGTAGYSTGDHNPNQDFKHPNDSSVDGDFTGFIPLQEMYAGSRVQSVFLLGGAGRVPRPLAIPVSNQVHDRIPTSINGFTNLAFVGGSANWFPQLHDRSIGLRPNVLSYWQTKATNAFDRTTGKSFHDKMARNYLGTELNIFADIDLLPEFNTFKLFAVSSVFIPGAHYTDIKGTPLSKDELRALESADVTGIIDDKNPFIGDNVAYTLNIGIECKF